MSGSNYCLWTCIQISQEADQGSGIPISLRIFQFVVIHTIKSFGIVNKTEVDIFLEPFAFLMIQQMLANVISGSSAFSKFSLNIWKLMVHVLLKPGLENFEHSFLACEMSAIVR